jgi:polysaccharide export outer membrane protein
MQYNVKQALLFASCAIVLSSCYYNKKLVYLQDPGYSESQPTVIPNVKSTYRLQPNDILSVKVKSSTDANVSDLFNITTTTQAAQFISPGNLFLEGYFVDTEGDLTLPIIGTFPVKDMTIEQARDTIQAKADRYLKNATVIVKLISFKITVLGEVRNPGYHYVYNNQVTILEALGLAGDLTSVASRKNVKLIRQTEKGSEVVLLDLTNPNLLKSKYFYLLPNDALYVEPLKARSGRLNLEHLTLVFSAATTAILILNYLDNN